MEDKLIYDVGMNTGSDTAYYLHCGFRVVGIEANPLLVKQARQRFSREINAGQLVLLGLGVGPIREKATFWVNERRDEWSAFSKEIGCRGGTPCHAVEVDCVPFAEILSEYGIPYYLKIDIEGHDHYCLSALQKNDLPKFISIEAHSVEYLRQLGDLGYREFKCVNQVDHNDPRAQTAEWRHPKVRLTRKARKLWHKLFRDRYGLQQSGNWKFAPGSSGPFGEETPGEWRPLEDVAADMEAWLECMGSSKSNNYTGNLNPSGWYDFHAKRDDVPGVTSPTHGMK